LLRTILLFGFLQMAFAVHVSKARVHVRENQDRAQLSVILQIAQLEVLPADLTLNKALVKIMQVALKNSLRQNSRLKYHQKFSHIFITALNKSDEEEVLALFSKTPRVKYPSIQFFRNESMDRPIADRRQKLPPRDLFDQLDAEEQQVASLSSLKE